MALFKQLYEHKNKLEVDKLVLFGKTGRQIYDWLRRFGTEDLSIEVIEDYVNNWPLVILIDSYKDYLNIIGQLEGWSVYSFDEAKISTDLSERNYFRRELILARTEYRLRQLYQNTLVDEKTYRDLTNILLTTMAHQEKLLDKKNETITVISETKEKIEENVSAIDVSDLEKYLYTKTPTEQQTIRSFLKDMQKVLKIVDLDQYTMKV